MADLVTLVSNDAIVLRVDSHADRMVAITPLTRDPRGGPEGGWTEGCSLPEKVGRGATPVLRFIKGFSITDEVAQGAELPALWPGSVIGCRRINVHRKSLMNKEVVIQGVMGGKLLHETEWQLPADGGGGARVSLFVEKQLHQPPGFQLVCRDTDADEEDACTDTSPRFRIAESDVPPGLLLRKGAAFTCASLTLSQSVEGAVPLPPGMDPAPGLPVVRSIDGGVDACTDMTLTLQDATYFNMSRWSDRGLWMLSAKKSEKNAITKSGFGKCGDRWHRITALLIEEDVLVRCLLQGDGEGEPDEGRQAEMAKKLREKLSCGILQCTDITVACEGSRSKPADDATVQDVPEKSRVRHLSGAKLTYESLRQYVPDVQLDSEELWGIVERRMVPINELWSRSGDALKYHRSITDMAKLCEEVRSKMINMADSEGGSVIYFSHTVHVMFDYLTHRALLLRPRNDPDLMRAEFRNVPGGDMRAARGTLMKKARALAMEIDKRLDPKARTRLSQHKKLDQYLYSAHKTPYDTDLYAKGICSKGDQCVYYSSNPSPHREKLRLLKSTMHCLHCCKIPDADLEVWENTAEMAELSAAEPELVTQRLAKVVLKGSENGHFKLGKKFRAGERGEYWSVALVPENNARTITDREGKEIKVKASYDIPTLKMRNAGLAPNVQKEGICFTCSTQLLVEEDVAERVDEMEGIEAIPEPSKEVAAKTLLELYPDPVARLLQAEDLLKGCNADRDSFHLREEFIIGEVTKLEESHREADAKRLTEAMWVLRDYRNKPEVYAGAPPPAGSQDILNSFNGIPIKMKKKKGGKK
eukprot:TRINITY_DN37983_c0_g1_i1.p1 TRINITY_DN37983_c0_g1~~TRINITY_DN37983_c0_g1_i1.p1  ORF type:complete len:843 (+),score=277.41 TRINITY_DN37983_c0_g1_i1:86-2530(+)